MMKCALNITQNKSFRMLYQWQENISTKLSSTFEVFASELVENFEEILNDKYQITNHTILCYLSQRVDTHFHIFTIVFI